MCDIQIDTFDILYIAKGTAKNYKNYLGCGFRKTANQRQTKQHTLKKLYYNLVLYYIQH